MYQGSTDSKGDTQMKMLTTDVTHDRKVLMNAKSIMVIDFDDRSDLHFDRWSDFAQHLAELGDCSERDTLCEGVFVIHNGSIVSFSSHALWSICEEIDEEVAEENKVRDYAPVVI
jgi:hypothetical protein